MKKILLSQHFQKLKQLTSKINIFEVMGVKSNENVHSNILSNLLDRHTPLTRSYNHILFEFLRIIIHKYPELNVIEIARLLNSRFTATREKFRIDILLEDWEHRTVIGIENKIFSVEREKQVEDYQRIIEERYPNFIKIMIFLTPEGYESRTQNSSSTVKCIQLSYEEVYWMLSNSEIVDPTGLIAWFAFNIKREIMMNTEEKRIARELWSDPETAKTLLILFEHRPKLEDIKDKLIAAVKKSVKTDIECDFYPEKKGDVKEIKITIEHWIHKCRLPITFMFYSYDTGPACRVFVYESDYAENTDAFSQLAEKSEKIDNSFSKIRGWSCWRKVFLEEDYPEDSFIDDFSFSNRTIEELMEKFNSDYNFLKKLVEGR